MSTLQTQGGVGAESLTQVSPDSSVGAAPAGFDPYSRMVNQYGAIPEGENPTRVVDVPTSTDGTDRVSRAARTAMEAAVTPDSAVEDIAQAVADASIPRGTKKGCGEAAFCFVQEIISKA